MNDPSAAPVVLDLADFETMRRHVRAIYTAPDPARRARRAAREIAPLVAAGRLPRDAVLATLCLAAALFGADLDTLTPQVTAHLDATAN